jgi:hypothetical protein
MNFRDTEENIYKAVRKDTKELFKKLEWEEQKVDGELDMITISTSLRNAIADKGLTFAKEKQEVKEALAIADSQEDYMLCVKHWMGRLLVNNRNLSSHRYNECAPNTRYNLDILLDGPVLCILLKEFKDVEGIFTLPKYVLKLSGKPSRVLAKLFGQELITYMCQSYPIQAAKLELHLSRLFIPELYQMIAKGEGHTSCMSKHAEEYGLDDDHHPTLAYEDSSNACLAMLYNTGKGRYVARAVCLLSGPEVQFSNSYGAAGSFDHFKEVGLTNVFGNMEGLELSKKDYEGELLVPYVDGNTQKLTDRGDCLVVDEDGELEGSYETGREVGGYMCEHCDEHSTEELTYAENGRSVCETCRDDEYRYVDGHLYHYEDCVYCESEGEYILSDDSVYCEYSDENYRDSEEMVDVKGGHSGRICRYSIVLRNLEDALENWTITEIGDQEPWEYLGLDFSDEQEEQEQAA